MTFQGTKICKRNDNRWFARVTKNKKQICIYGKTQQLCYNNVKKYFITNLKTKNINTKETYTLYSWMEKWVNVYKKDKLKQNSIYQINNCINKHIKPNIIDIKLGELTLVDINTAINKIQSSRMKKYTYDCYKDCLREAYKNRLIKENISDLINKVTHTREKGTALSEEQRKILLINTKKLTHGKIFEFMMFAGTRPQGALNLKWEDIKENCILINETKSKNAQRYIPKFNKLCEIFKNIKQENELVFNISQTTMKREHEKLKKLCNFDFQMKSLRHTFATICYENGIQDTIVAKWMGHSNANTTKQYYVHIQDKHEQEQANELNNIFDTSFDTK
ncbi:MAG: tyrosine-type recombinase/integrase [Clostridia bacterium]